MDSIPPYVFEGGQLQAGAARFFNQRAFSDLVIVAPDGRRLFCHRFALAACSQLLAASLAAGPAPGQELPVTGVDPDALEDVIRYFYEGRLTLTPRNAAAVLDCARRLRAGGAADAAAAYLRGGLAPRGAVAALGEAMRYDLDDVAEEALATALVEFDEAVAAASYVQAPLPAVLRLLQAARTAGLRPGRTLFAAAWRWLTADPAHVEEIEGFAPLFSRLDVSQEDLASITGAASLAGSATMVLAAAAGAAPAELAPAPVEAAQAAAGAGGAAPQLDALAGALQGAGASPSDLAALLTAAAAASAVAPSAPLQLPLQLRRLAAAVLPQLQEEPHPQQRDGGARRPGGAPAAAPQARSEPPSPTASAEAAAVLDAAMREAAEAGSEDGSEDDLGPPRDEAEARQYTPDGAAAPPGGGGRGGAAGADAAGLQLRLRATRPFSAGSAGGESGGGGGGGGGGGTRRHGAICQIDGCYADLSSLRDYYQRYRVCELHIRAPIVTLEGRQQRFCQQCGRFHPIGDFDGTKRSCRFRLQRHNQRRRKRDPETGAPAPPRDGAAPGGGGAPPAKRRPSGRSGSRSGSRPGGAGGATGLDMLAIIADGGEGGGAPPGAAALGAAGWPLAMPLLPEGFPFGAAAGLDAGALAAALAAAGAAGGLVAVPGLPPGAPVVDFGALGLGPEALQALMASMAGGAPPPAAALGATVPDSPPEALLEAAAEAAAATEAAPAPAATAAGQGGEEQPQPAAGKGGAGAGPNLIQASSSETKQAVPSGEGSPPADGSPSSSGVS
ncbi:MAG: hypothetical protein J3K34DRAFT_515702 [Monoraphidium minutum]|nr:MAG: hypothetical protein J3K34DRAFT_515702 [Monoraphidium minutum]